MQIGLYLSPKHHAEMIVTDNKTMIVKAKRFYRYLCVPVYLLSDQKDEELKCYGKIVLGNPKPITVGEFRGLRSKHRITEKEKDEWWPGYLNFYAYEVQVLEVYDPPKRIQVPPGIKVQIWLRSWKWLDPAPRELHLEKIRDLVSYDPTKVPKTKWGNAVLRDDMRILLAWWSAKQQGKGPTYSLELIEQKYRAVLKELIKRKAATLHPGGYKQHTRELFDRAKRSLEGEDIEIPIKKSLYARVREIKDDEALIAYHDSLHQLYSKGEGASREDIVNAHFFALQEMKRRGLPHEIVDDLDRELRKAKSRLVPFVIIDSYISHTGSAVYELREPHDCDLVIRDSEENPKVTQALLRAIRLPSDEIHRVYDKRGPAFDYVPLLDLVAVPVNWRGPWPRRETQHEGIPEHSWDLYRALPPAMLVEDPYATLADDIIFVREAERDSGVELKLRRLLPNLVTLTFDWCGPQKTMQGKPIFKSYLVPHIPLTKVEINEPLFRRYY